MSDSGASRLALYLAAAYTLLVIYASLHPFTGWRDLGAPPLGFLDAGWPRYFTVFDLVVNVLAYVPLGFFWIAALHRMRWAWLGVILVALAGTALSLAMETTQNYLPSRVPSNVDLGCNSLGTLLGALIGARWGKTLVSGGRLHNLRTHWFIADSPGEAGLVLLALWLLTQLNPEILLFGTGDVRSLLGLEIALPFDIQYFQRIEAVIAAANTLAIGMLCTALLQRRPMAFLFALVIAALAIRTFAAALLVDPSQALRWLTPGNGSGLLIGLALALPLMMLPAPLRRMLGGCALLFATVLVNVAPENPYLSQAAQVWRQGHFLNFNGLTRLASVLWPFLALAWLLLPEREAWKLSKT